MVYKFMSLIDPICIKSSFTEDEYNKVKEVSTGINSTVLYAYYQTIDPEPMSYSDFYKWLKANFYYDKYVCKHGTEFVYYVKGRDDSFKRFLEMKRFNGFTDVLYVWRMIWNG